MPPIDFGSFEVLTFDCYGTLIDWEAGISAGLRGVLDPRGVALAAGLAAGLPLNAAARQAVAAAGLSTTRAGARGGMPTAAELAATSGK